MIEDEMVGWHHWFSGHEFEQTLGDSEVHWSLACCSLWDQKELDMTEWLNNKAVWLMDELSTASPTKRKVLGCGHAGTPVRDNRGQLVWTTVIVSFPKGSFHQESFTLRFKLLASPNPINCYIVLPSIFCFFQDFKGLKKIFPQGFPRY